MDKGKGWSLMGRKSTVLRVGGQGAFLRTSSGQRPLIRYQTRGLSTTSATPNFYVRIRHCLCVDVACKLINMYVHVRRAVHDKLDLPLDLQNIISLLRLGFKRSYLIIGLGLKSTM